MATDPTKKSNRRVPKAVKRDGSSAALRDADEARRPHDRPWLPPVVSAADDMRGMPGVLHPSDVRALRAVWDGVANGEQQRRAMLAVHKICQTNDISYRPDDHGGDRDTVFAEGKRFVGMQMQKFIDHHAKFVSDEKKQA